MSGERVFYLAKCPKCRELKVTAADPTTPKRNIKCICGHRYKLSKAERTELKLGGII
jgi:hypothetical protein